MRVLTFVLTALLVASCGDNPFGPSGIKENTWKLESVERAGSPTIQAPNDRYTLRLNNDGTLSVQADCNQCTATYTLKGSALTIGPLQCTSISCGVGSIDGTYATILTGTSQVETSDSHSVLVIRNSVATLRFRN
jgi:heat shock protein HslJ